VVNCAGLDAQSVAGRIAGVPAHAIAAQRLAKGSYFTLQGRAPFSRLIYPVPQTGGLGVHLTLDTGGQAKFGPDVEWVDRIDYTVDPSRAAGFYGAVRRFWPDLPDGALQPGYAGIRPKLAATAPDGFADFIVSGPANHGVRGLVQLFGIESPGLTAALALGELVLAEAGPP
jgi:L-2-hydroxyglutarate oxidase LhgO